MYKLPSKRPLTAAFLACSLAGFAAPSFSSAAAVDNAQSATPSKATVKPEPSSKARALAAADATADKGLGNLTKKSGEDYKRLKEASGPKGLHYVVYQKTYKNLPVVGADAVVTAKEDGSVLDSALSTQASTAVPSTSAKLDAATAQSKARGVMDKVEKAEKAKLVIYMAGGTKATLAYEVKVSGTKSGKPSVKDVYVDAASGALVGQTEYVRMAEATGKGNHNGDVKFTTTQSGSSYQTKSTAAPGLTCTNQSQTLYTDSDNVWGNGSGTDMPTACVDLMYAGEQENDMMKLWAGRSGVNGSGSFFQGRVGMSETNAFWTGSYANFGKNQANNKQLTPIDVVAHEYGHGVYQFSGNGGGGQGEQGGMNESTGDILGAATECYQNEKFPNAKDKCDYEVGEMVDLVGKGPIRYMYDPSKVGDPNCATEVGPSTEVHRGAGPQNHWFYLLAEGSAPTNGQPKSPICSGGPSEVKGIGPQKATNIFLNALQRKTSSWNHKNARIATLNSAVALYPGDCNVYDSVANAWLGAGVAKQSGEPARPTQCGDTQGDYTMSVNPSSGSVAAGSSAKATVATQNGSGAGQEVKLTASGLPAGATATFDPATMTTGASSSMTVQTSSNTPEGTYPITVTASGKATKTATYNLTVTAGGGGEPQPQPSTPPTVDMEKTKGHLAEFQRIASANGGNRRAGSAGYTASVNYVVGKLEAAGFKVTKQRCTSCDYPSDNIIADWPGGDESKTVMFGSHLDGVAAGPGINDNGSGSAGVLQTALTLAEKKPNMLNHARFAWWTDEEQGLNGSKFYVNNLSSTAKSNIKAYYNFDMIASPNAGYFINNISKPQAAPMKEYWDSLKIQPEENTEGVGRSDDYPFTQAGIPASGYASGASARKTSAQASKWGGTAGSAYDSCYHSRCDSYPDNINTTALERSNNGMVYTLWKQAVKAESAPAPAENDFSMQATPSSASVKAGNATTATLNSSIVDGVAQPVALSASGAPAGTNITFDPATVKAGSSSSMRIQTAATTPAGTYTITVTGKGRDATRTTTFSLTVTRGGWKYPRS